MPRRFPWRIERPVFITAPPRSGSTLLFERRPDRFERLVRRPRMRYLDKTKSTCFRRDPIQEMFPDASRVFLTGDPRSNIASMVSGWPELQRFGKPVLRKYVRAAESTVHHWTYAAPLGWRGALDRELPEICAWSWQQHAEELIRFRESVTPGHLHRYEDLVQDPVVAVTRLAGELDLEVTDDIVRYPKRPHLSRTTLTPPTATADIQPNIRAQVEAVFPTVSTTANRSGY
jgi:hypothetical protein